MNLPMIQEPQDVARRKLAAYTRGLRRRTDAEYTAVAEGYRELAAGRKLLHLDNAIAAAGWNELGQPKLAIARADRRIVRFEISGFRDRGGRLIFHSGRPGYQGGDSLWRSVELAAMPPEPAGVESWRRARAIVPLIPADVRPATGRPKDWFILFEAEWRNVAPVDPFLLRHLAGSLYVVLAEWNLTPLEQAIVMGRLDEPR
jgi:hypothetical protein